ncbi:MAG: AsmA family protein, partial [Pseudomonadota bacterium]
MSWFSRIVLGVVFLLVVAIGAAATAVMLINPVDVVSNRLVAQVKQTTGRDLTIKGGTGLSFWPKLAVSLKDVTLSPPPGMTAPDTLRASEVAVRVAIWPLLNGRAQVESVALEAPVFDLRRDTSGRTSWTFAGLKLPLGRTRFAQATGQTATDARSPASRGAADARTLALLDKLELNAVRITRGTVNYTDEQSGHAEAFRNIDITIQGRSLRDRATINGQMLVRGTTMNFDATLGVPRDLLTGRPADIAVKLASDDVAGTLNGKVDLTGATVFRGPLFASSASLSRIAKLAAYQAPNADQLGNMKVAGDLVVRGPEVNLNRARITLGEVQASGALGGRFDGPRPALTADLKINQLDIDKFTAGAAGVAPGALPASSTPGSAAASGGGQPNSIDDLLRRSQVKGFVGRDGWDATPIDTSVLRAADVRVKVQAGPVTGSGVRLDSARLRLALNNGSARLDVDDAKLYDGTLRGIVTLDPAKPGLRLGANMRANGFAARRLLKDFAGVDMLAASTDARIAVGSGGASV